MYDPSISVHKGYNLSKEAEEFLISHGLKNALFSISVNDMKDNLFGKLGKLVACPYQVCNLCFLRVLVCFLLLPRRI